MQTNDISDSYHSNSFYQVIKSANFTFCFFKISFQDPDLDIKNLRLVCEWLHVWSHTFCTKYFLIKAQKSFLKTISRFIRWNKNFWIKRTKLRIVSTHKKHVTLIIFCHIIYYLIVCLGSVLWHIVLHFQPIVVWLFLHLF